MRWRPSHRHFDEHAQFLLSIHNVLERLLAVTAEKYKPDLLLPPQAIVDRFEAETEAQANTHARTMLDHLVPPTP